jgi:Flp pilus assembly protein TadB
MKKKKSQKKTSSRMKCNPDVENKVLELELEISKLNREKSILVLNKAIFLYFLFIIIAVVGIVNGYVAFFNVLIIMGLCVLVIGTFPYVKTMYNEEKRLNSLVNQLKQQVNR